MPNLPPITLILDRYSCDPEDGILRVAKTGPGYRKSTPIGHAIGHLNRHGYLHFCSSFSGKRYSLLVHRVVWAVLYGDFAPSDLMIDHINRVRTDNRQSNLRLVDARGNCLNSAATSKGDSIPYGVSKLIRHGRTRYQAGKTYQGKRYYLGIFDTPAEAALAVQNWSPA